MGSLKLNENYIFKQAGPYFCTCDPHFELQSWWITCVHHYERHLSHRDPFVYKVCNKHQTLGAGQRNGHYCSCVITACTLCSSMITVCVCVNFSFCPFVVSCVMACVAVKQRLMVSRLSSCRINC